MPLRTSFKDPIIASLAGFSIGVAYLAPGTYTAVFFGWIAATTLVYLMAYAERPYRAAYLAGIIANSVIFYWLAHTISVFGNFGTIPTAFIFLLFVTLSAIQYLIATFIYINLPLGFHSFGLNGAIAVTLSELLSIRIFPWYYGHTQLAFTPFVQIADIAGALFVTFMLVWVAESVLRLFLLGEFHRRLVVAPLLFMGCLSYGTARMVVFANPEGPLQSISVIQGNVSIEEKHEQTFVEANKDRYVQLTSEVLEDGKLIIWPESVITDWIRTDVKHTRLDPRLPRFHGENHILLGALTFDRAGGFYNSALAIYSDGSIPVPYHKQILMPFGEYVPFSQTFPWLKEIAHLPGEFTPGRSTTVFAYPTENGPLRVAPLICYEDIVSRLSREATLGGAELLVSISNDAWFGETHAPFQHHILASFRAIENRRFLIRSTNTGYTAVVSPLGKTTLELPLFAEDTLTTEVPLISELSIYTVYNGERIWWALCLLCTCIILCKRAINRGKRSSGG